MKLKPIVQVEKRRRVFNTWAWIWGMAFFTLLALGALENYFVVHRWIAVRTALYNGHNAEAWNLLGRNLTDPND